MTDVVREVKDLRYLKWSKTRSSSGTAGTFLKSYESINGRKVYYKLSDYDLLEGIVGHECVNEIIAGRLMDALGISHLKYRLVHADIQIDGKDHRTWLCESEDFKLPGESKISMDDYYIANKMESEMPMDFCARMGWGETISEMLLIDYLILNRDRHGANIEVLRNRFKKQIRIAPLFDQGLSFVCRIHEVSGLEGYDVMENKPVQSFVGGRNSEDNLDLIPDSWWRKVSLPENIDKNVLFEDLEGVLDERYYEVIFRMLERRMGNARSIRDSRCIHEG